MNEFIYFLIGLLISFLLLYWSPGWEPFKERLSRSFRSLRRLRTKPKPLKIGTIDLTGVEAALLNPVRIGDMVFPMRRLIGGDGKTRYRFPDGIICIQNREKLVLPPEIQQAYPTFLEKRRMQAFERGAVFEQRDHMRLDDYEIGLHGLEDAPWPLKLIVSVTDYHTIQATNYSIEETLPGGATIREKYATDPGNLKNSVLGNPLAVNLSVVTADRKVYISVRGKKTAATHAGFAPAVSGTGNPHTDCNEKGIYTPFLTAQREAAEEITGYRPDFTDITFFGLARTLRFQLPFLFGEIRLRNMTSKELESSFPRDTWETEAFLALPLKIDVIVAFIREVYREMEEKNIVGSATYAALFSLLQSLRYEYPDDWTRIVRKLGTLGKK